MDENNFILADRIAVIKQTIEKYGADRFYISFSGGKDSTIVHHLIDEALPNNCIPRAMRIDLEASLCGISTNRIQIAEVFSTTIVLERKQRI